MFNNNLLGAFFNSKKQHHQFIQLLKNQFLDNSILVFDSFGNMSGSSLTGYFDKSDLLSIENIFEVWENVQNQSIIVINGLEQVLELSNISAIDFYEFANKYADKIQFIMLDLLSNLGNNYSQLTTETKLNISSYVIGGDLQQQNLITIPYSTRSQRLMHMIHYIEDENIREVVLPSI